MIEQFIKENLEPKNSEFQQISEDLNILISRLQYFIVL